MFPSFSIQKGSSAPPGTTQDITAVTEETATVNKVKMAAKDPGKPLQVLTRAAYPSGLPLLITECTLTGK